jgi:hypothetical protein
MNSDEFISGWMLAVGFVVRPVKSHKLFSRSL